MKEVVREVFLDHIPFVADTDNEIPYAMGGIDFHHVPEDRAASDFHYRFRLEIRLLADAGSKTTC